MRFATLLGALLAAAAPLSVEAVNNMVFAHYMLGDPGADVWAATIKAAKAAGIDGFALNAASTYDDAPQALTEAYAAAEAAGGFNMFISFDMGASTFDVNTVASWINAHKNSSAQLMIKDKPFVSTFEGCTFATNGEWSSVEQQTGALYLMPSFSYCGDVATTSKMLSSIDGAFNWVAWPNGPGPMTTDGDKSYMSTLTPAGKAYMMPVSPWMYTNLPEYNKNWILGSDTLWFDRWEQVLTVKPQFVEIITWNDFGESHYIGDRSQGTVDEQEGILVDGIPHVAWQKALPYYTAAYKNGVRPANVPSVGAIFWYRTTPKAACSDGGTTCVSAGVSATTCTQDNVYVMTFTNNATTATVSIGGVSKTLTVQPGVNIAQVPFSASKTGSVVVTMNGSTATGAKPITNNCPAAGWVNFNPVVGSTF